VPKQQIVCVFDEQVPVPAAEPVPVPGEKMIPAHVHDDPGEPAALLAESGPAPAGYRVVVGIPVDSPVQQDSFTDPGIEAAGRIALDEVTEKVSEQRVFAVTGQKQMGKIVHNGQMSGPPLADGADRFDQK
jgi:hypothetical protein